jgi:hypothetical protein
LYSAQCSPACFRDCSQLRIDISLLVVLGTCKGLARSPATTTSAFTRTRRFGSTASSESPSTIAYEKVSALSRMTIGIDLGIPRNSWGFLGMSGVLTARVRQNSRHLFRIVESVYLRRSMRISTHLILRFRQFTNFFC